MYLADELPVPWKAISCFESFALSRPRQGNPPGPWESGGLNADVRIVLGGDLRPDSRPFESAFGHLETLLAGADLCSANLEIPLSNDDLRTTERDLRTASHAQANILARSGWTVLNVANNHSLDRGSLGLSETIGHLNRTGIVSCGAVFSEFATQPVAIRQCKGVNVGFLGYCDDHREFEVESRWPRLALADPDLMVSEVRRARDEIDLLIVHLHWGYEFSLHPLLRHRNCARQLIDAGADIVACHHAHVPLGVERWGQGLIAYGLGNTLFPMSPYVAQGHPWTKTSFLLEVGVGAGGIAGFSIHPFHISDSGQIKDPGKSFTRHFSKVLASLSRRIGDSDLLGRLERCRLIYEAIRLTGIIADGAELRAELIRRLSLPRQKFLLQQAPLGDQMTEIFLALNAAASHNERLYPQPEHIRSAGEINQQLRSMYDWKAAMISRLP